MVPTFAEADKVTDPASQRLPGVPLTVGIAYTVANTAVLAEVQVPVEAST